jgi:hypothetical protein
MMTFVNEKELGLSLNHIDKNFNLKKIVVEKLTNREFILADFNWAGNYDTNNIGSYLKEPYQCNAVIEIRLNLDFATISNRHAIYDRCLAALNKDEVVLMKSEQHINPKSNKLQDLITFDMVA